MNNVQPRSQKAIFEQKSLIEMSKGREREGGGRERRKILNSLMH